MILGVLVEEHAVGWSADSTTADGARGALWLDYERFPAACTNLMRRAMHALASPNGDAAESLFATIDWKALPIYKIATRFARFPYPSLVYSIRS